MSSVMMGRASKGVLVGLMGLSALVPTMVVGIGTVDASSGVFSGGSGTVNDPYQIETAIQLNAVRDNVNGHYKLTQDVDISGDNWTPVEDFKGSLDGNNRSIIGLTINTEADQYIGFFTSLEGQVRNLEFEDVYLDVNSRYVGVLAGQLSKNTVVDNVTISGDVITGAKASGTGAVGMLAGTISSTLGNEIKVNDVTVSGTIKGYGTSVGGLIGKLRFIDISNSTSNVDIDVSDASTVGGFIGSNYVQPFTVINSKATGDIAGGSIVGGFIGELHKRDESTLIDSSYATGNVKGSTRVGGFVGSLNPDSELRNHVVISNAYATGDVVIENSMRNQTGSRWAAGGFHGRGSGLMQQVYATGNVTATGVSTVAGGLNGLGGSSTTISSGYSLNKYVTGGMVVGYGTSANKNIYTYDGSGITDTTSKLEPKELMNKDTYTFNGFQFGDTGEAKWGIDEGSSLPYLLFDPQRNNYNIDSGEWEEVEKPMEPTLPDEPNVPGGSNGASQSAFVDLQGGELTLATTAVRDFGTHELSSQAQEIKSGFSGDFTVNDYRGTQVGWRLDVTSTQFSEVAPTGGFRGGYEVPILPIGTLMLDGLEGVEQQDGGSGVAPSVLGTVGTVIDGGTIGVLGASVGEGAGSWGLEYGAEALTLVVDSTSVKIDREHYPDGPTPYESTISWDLVSAP